MKNIILLSIIVMSTVGCSNREVSNETNDIVNVDSIIYESNVDISKIDTILKKSDVLELTVKKTIESEISLKKENKTLKTENSKLRDSVSYMVNELKVIQTKIKEPKRKNFIQKVFNLTTDSIEIIKLDTIKE